MSQSTFWVGALRVALVVCVVSSKPEQELSVDSMLKSMGGLEQLMGSGAGGLEQLMGSGPGGLEQLLGGEAAGAKDLLANIGAGMGGNANMLDAAMRALKNMSPDDMVSMRAKDELQTSGSLSVSTVRNLKNTIKKSSVGIRLRADIMLVLGVNARMNERAANTADRYFQAVATNDSELVEGAAAPRASCESMQGIPSPFSQPLGMRLLRDGVVVLPRFLGDLSVPRRMRAETRLLKDRNMLTQGKFHNDGSKGTRCDKFRCEFSGIDGSLAQAHETAIIEIMRLVARLNVELGAALLPFETQIAYYTPKSVYGSHTDAACIKRMCRGISILYYMSEWNPDDGGELKIGTTVVPPHQDTLVIFRPSLWHEVLETSVERSSLTLWVWTDKDFDI